MSTFPYSLDSEKGILGTLLLQPESFNEYDNNLRESDFFDPACRRIFTAICKIVDRGEVLRDTAILALLEPADHGLFAEAIAAAVPGRAAHDIAVIRRDSDRRKELKKLEERREKVLSDPNYLNPENQLVAHDALDLLKDAELIEPPILVAGLLHKGSALLLGASSKSFKSWSLIELAVSVASGSPWWNLPCGKGRVLYADFELTPYFWRKRAMEIAEARGLTLDGVRVMNCRGHEAGAALLAIEREAQDKPFDLIVLDPLYSFLVGRDENSAGDVGMVLRKLAMLAESTGAALAISHHFSKGNQSAKEAIDRFSGSGVFARFPDALLTMTRHEEDGAFVVDATVRNFAPINPFVLRWEHPLMVRDGSLNPANVKKPAGTFESKYSVEQLVALLGVESMSFGQIVTKAKDAFGMSKATADRLLKQGQEAGTVEKLNMFYRAVSRVSRP